MTDALHISLTVGQWHVINGTLDNVASDAAESSDMERWERLTSYRRVGEGAAAAHPKSGLGAVGWPPDEAVLEIELDCDVWEEIIGLLTTDAETMARIAEHPEFAVSTDPAAEADALNALADFIGRRIAK